MNLYWISWYQPGEDWRVLTWPPPDPILAYWCSGYAGDLDDEKAVVVALVRADSPEAARAAVTGAGAWPDAGEERFCDVTDRPPGDRFPRPTTEPMASRWPWPVPK